MIICAWCGKECDDRTYFRRSESIIFVGNGGDDTKADDGYVWSQSTIKKYFCSAQCRINWFLEP